MDGKKRISCRRCQLRKLKCTRVHPCANCVSSSSECSFRDDDTRRRPVNRAYVAALEERLASYEATIRSLQQQSPSNPPSLSSTSLLAQTPGTSVPVAGTAVPDLIFDYSGSSRVSTLTLQPSPQGHRSFYGPTSIYQKGCVTDGNNNDSNRRDQPPPTINAYQDIYLSGIFKLEDLVLNDSLSMFFRHLNAECPFIDETALVQDFTRNKHMGKFWSYPLLYAICLLGARISRDPQVSATVDPLKRCVHKLLSFKRLQSPHITIVQAFFCLALFEFGAGNNSKGWLLSGMAVRMLQDMGLHQDPRFLVQDDSSISLAQDSQMRRKVFWGCYVTDKVISLYFGRPVHLRHDDAAVDFLDPEVCQAEAERGPELAEVDSPLYTLLDNSIPSSILLIHLADLSRIIESMMADVFSTRLIKLPRKDLVTHRVAKLEELNLRLFQWHTALPETFAWNQWTPTTQTLPPQLTILHALYHSCIISLNRHFIRPTPGFARKTQSRDICISSADSIMAITRHYRAQHSLATAPLVLVYSLAMAATAVTFALDSSVSPHDQSAELAQHMNFLVKTLNECSKTYEVASHISERLKRGPQKKKNAQREEEDEEEGGEEGGEEEEITPSSQDADADVHDCLQPAQVLPETVIPEETLQVPGAEAWGTSWWNDGVMGFAQPDNMEGQLDVLLTSGDQEGDMMANFNWSNMMI